MREKNKKNRWRNRQKSSGEESRSKRFDDKEECSEILYFKDYYADINRQSGIAALRHFLYFQSFLEHTHPAIHIQHPPSYQHQTCFASELQLPQEL